MDYRPLFYWSTGIALAIVAILVGVSGFCIAGIRPLLYSNPYMALIVMSAAVAVIPVTNAIKSLWFVVGTLAVVASWAGVATWAIFVGNGSFGLPPLESVAYFAAVSSAVMVSLAYLHLHVSFGIPSPHRVSS
jgi:hypothetical protein